MLENYHMLKHQQLQQPHQQAPSCSQGQQPLKDLPARLPADVPTRLKQVFLNSAVSAAAQ
jgi:hypothetical protein